jgi:leader peptidase (prepilin peptidase)/N-methyltransferase
LYQPAIQLNLSLPFPNVAALLVVASAAEHQWYGLLRGAIGMLALAGFYLLLALLRPGELGFGDVKLSGFVGLSLGWLGWRVLMLGVIAGPALGAAALLLFGRRGVEPRFRSHRSWCLAR